MRLGSPYVLVFLPFLIWLVTRWGRKASHVYSSVTVLKGVASPRSFMTFLKALLMAAVLLMVVALADPQIAGERSQVLVSTRCMVFTLDISGSMEMFGTAIGSADKTALDVAQEVALGLIKARPDDRIGLTLFDMKGTRIWRLSHDHEPTVAWLSVPHRGYVNGTDIAEGLQFGAKVMLKNSDGCGRTLILISDAGDTIKPEDFEALRAVFIKERIQFFWVLIGDGGDAKGPLDRLSRETGGRGFLTNNAAEFHEAFRVIGSLVTKPVWVPSPREPQHVYQYPFGAGTIILVGLYLVLRTKTLL